MKEHPCEHLPIHNYSKVWGGFSMFSKEMSYAEQRCIYLIKNTV